MTTDRTALYHSVCAHPDDDTPRLIFADLIEEQGDAETAVFIRTQISLARVLEYDPFAVKCRRFDPAAVSGWTMTHTLPAIPSAFEWRPFAFRRGFPWLIGVREVDAALEQLPDLFASSPVQALGYHHTKPDFASLAACPHLAHIRRIEFHDGARDAVELKGLEHSIHFDCLSELAFEHDGIDAGGLRYLVESSLFPRLNSLALGWNLIPPDLLVDALGAATEPGQLRELSLVSNGLLGDDAAHLFALPVVQGLVDLDLSDNPRLGVKGAVALAESGALHGMRRLDLCKTLPCVPGVKALADSAGLAGVRWLDLSENRLGPVAVRRLTESEHVCGLRVLLLWRNGFGDAGAEAIAGCRHLTGLLELAVSDNGIGDAGAIALAESPFLEELIALDLRLNPIGPAAAARLLDRFGDRVRL